MKKIIYIIVLSLLALYIFFFPGDAIRAASRGLVLWYTKMLPTLLPFAILSYLFIRSGILNALTAALHPFLSVVFPVSQAGVYPLIAGFLFGFPMGSKITAQLVEEKKLSYREGNFLFAICNNISPVFITGFIVEESLKRPELKLITLILLYLPPLLFYIIGYHLLPPEKRWDISKKKAAPRSQINFKIIDAGIMSGFETLTRLGGYIMIFAILAQMTTLLPFKNPQIQCLFVGLMEITNGISCFAKTRLHFSILYPYILFLTAFGGMSGIAQTASMVKEAGFSMRYYVCTRLFCSITTVILTILCIRFRLW